MFDTALPQLAQVVLDFVDGYLAGTPGAVDRLTEDGDVPGVLRLE